MSKKFASPRELYFDGKITAEEYLKKLENSREADRKRRAIEERVNKLTAKAAQYCRA